MNTVVCFCVLIESLIEFNILIPFAKSALELTPPPITFASQLFIESSITYSSSFNVTIFENALNTFCIIS